MSVSVANLESSAVSERARLKQRDARCENGGEELLEAHDLQGPTWMLISERPSVLIKDVRIDK